MKTPEEIAQEIVHACSTLPTLNTESLISLIAFAIKQDRCERIPSILTTEDDVARQLNQTHPDIKMSSSNESVNSND